MLYGTLGTLGDNLQGALGALVVLGAALAAIVEVEPTKIDLGFPLLCGALTGTLALIASVLRYWSEEPGRGVVDAVRSVAAEGTRERHAGALAIGNLVGFVLGAAVLLGVGLGEFVARL